MRALDQTSQTVSLQRHFKRVLGAFLREFKGSPRAFKGNLRELLGPFRGVVPSNSEASPELRGFTVATHIKVMLAPENHRIAFAFVWIIIGEKLSSAFMLTFGSQFSHAPWMNHFPTHPPTYPKFAFAFAFVILKATHSEKLVLLLRVNSCDNAMS